MKNILVMLVVIVAIGAFAEDRWCNCPDWWESGEKNPSTEGVVCHKLGIDTLKGPLFRGAQPLPGCQPDPVYPEEAKKARIAGYVDATIVLDEQGVLKFTDVCETRFSAMYGDATEKKDWGFESAVRNVLETWEFCPQIYDGVPTISAITVLFFFIPGREFPMAQDEIDLRQRHKIRRYERKQHNYLNIGIEGELYTDRKCDQARETALQFIRENCKLFGLCDPRVKMDYATGVPRGEYDFPYERIPDSTESIVGGRQQVCYHLMQYYCDVPVLSTHIGVSVWRDGSAVTTISASIIPDINLDCGPFLSEDAAIERLRPHLNGPERHCNAEKIGLFVVQADSSEHAVWRFDLTCRPDLGHHWGEEAWLDANTGEIIKTFGTWIE